MYGGIDLNVRKRDPYHVYGDLIKHLVQIKGLSEYGLLKSRQLHFKNHRFAVLWWMRKRLRFTFEQIGQGSNMHHTTVMHAVAQVDNVLAMPEANEYLYDVILDDITRFDQWRKTVQWK